MQYLWKEYLVKLCPNPTYYSLISFSAIIKACFKAEI